MFYPIDSLRPHSLFCPEVRRFAADLEVDALRLEGLGQGRGREAEVIMVLARAGHDLLLIHKPHYPNGVFRLPTGGVEAGEAPQQAATREIYEESGYTVEAPGLLGVAEYSLRLAGTMDSAAFVSYIFYAAVPADQPPQATDLSESIAAYCWQPPAALAETATHLRALPAAWAYWGRFRALTYGFIADAVLEYSYSTAHHADANGQFVAGR